MNKRLLCASLIAMVVAFVTGCSDRVDLEDVSFSLVIGLDLDNDDNLVVYMISSAFSRDVKKKSEELVVTSKTLRQARGKLDAQSVGVVLGRKTQLFVVGKKILQHEDWFKLMDAFFRDAKNTVTLRVVAVDGPVSDIIYLYPKDKPILPLYLSGLIDTKSRSSETVRTTLQELHRQLFDKGVTPYIAQVKREEGQEMSLVGTALLDQQGKYALTLDGPETSLLYILQNNTKKSSISLTIPVPDMPRIGPFHTDYVSFGTQKIKTKINSSYRENKFRFDYNIEIDPFGLGIYARAHHYKQFKEVEDHWGETLANADIHVSVKVKIQAMGPVK
jgi:Ger(x)C family germination protein